MTPFASHPLLARSRAALLCAALLASALWLLALAPAPALAGQASAGELFFYPCSSCHPVVPGAPLPNEFKGHGIVLQGHDKLGKADTACLACHDDPAKDPGKLKLADGSLIDITGHVAQVCYRCHSAKYQEWTAGIHGKNKPKCTSSGCHDPHTPGYIYAEPLRPFVATGFQFAAVSERVAFTPLAAPPPDPHVLTPPWYSAVALVGLVIAGGLLGSLFVGRSKR